MSSLAEPIRLRRADVGDIWDVLAWRNDPASRRNSLDQEFISPAAHKGWFLRAIRDSQKVMLIGECGQEKVGVVRFDFPAPCRVSMVLAPAARGRGYGRIVLSLALESIGQSCFAEIKEDNAQSEKVFLACGFRLTSAEGAVRLYHYTPEAKAV